MAVWSKKNKFLAMSGINDSFRMIYYFDLIVVPYNQTVTPPHQHTKRLIFRHLEGIKRLLLYAGSGSFLYIIISRFFAQTKSVIFVIMRKEILIISILIAICFPSCQKHKRREDAVRIVAEWTGKEIKFPKNVPCYIR